jgi:D-glycero-D-manno-heptose 1,7-bisphosphate phosphatase
MKKPAVFFDRDGVINKEKNYLYKVSDFEWIADAKEAIKHFNDKGYYVFVVTNQSGIARGYYSEKDMNILHNYINNELNKVGAKIDEFFHSPYHPDIINEKHLTLSHLRKPNTGMLDLAFKKWNIEKNKSLLIGDQNIDIECAVRFGIKGHLFIGGSLLKFVKKIERH